MGKVIKRVPLDFDWPMNEVWFGYVIPEGLLPKTCAACNGSGYSPEGQLWLDKWYGHAPFYPSETGSVSHSPDDAEIVAAMYEKLKRTTTYEERVRFYGEGRLRTCAAMEAHRMCRIWNGKWHHHLDQDDVNAIHAAGFISAYPADGPCPTAAEVNRRSVLEGIFFMDSMATGVAIEARCARDDAPVYCPVCGGDGEVWNSEVRKRLYNRWTPTEPPEGDGWQVWETVSEGSPVTPVYPTAEALIEALVEVGYEREAATAFVHGGYVPSLYIADGIVYSDIEAATVLEKAGR